MEEVLDIYKRPYDPKYPVVCVDESSKQLTKDVREPLAARSGTVYKYDTEYERNGTASIFMGFEPLSLPTIFSHSDSCQHVLNP